MTDRRTKTTQATDAFIAGNYTAAFRIFRNFGKVFNRAELRVIQIAYESLVGYAKFYQALNIDVKDYIADAKQLIIYKYPQVKI